MYVGSCCSHTPAACPCPSDVGLWLAWAVLKGLFGGEEVVFPIDTSSYRASGLVTQESKREMVSESKGGSLMAAPGLKSGETFVTLDVEKWGLKDAEDYVDPRVTVCVYGTSPPVTGR